MLNRIISFSISNKLIVALFTIALLIYGLFEINKLPIDAVPDITNNQVQVITISPALGATDIERFLTIPIEQFVSNIPGLKEVRSFSRFGLSVITIVFDDETDIYWARQQVAERLTLAQESIPKEFGFPEIAPLTTGLGEIYQYTVRTEPGYENKYTATELRTIQDWIVRKQLISVKGVADVASFGGFLKQYEISVDPAKLKAHNINIIDVFKAIENNNQNTGGSYIEKGPTVLFIRSEGIIKSLSDIEKICIKNISNGIPLLVRDVAEVKYSSATRFGAITYNGKGEVAGAVVMMLKGANSNVVIENVKTKIEQIQKSLPKGVVIDAFLDRTKMVNNSINTVIKNLLEGALIVIFVLVLFLGNFRASFLVASVIPLSMLFAIIMMNIFGVSGNLMSLGALDFGLIVDGAVIIVEAVMHRFHKSHLSEFSELTLQKGIDEEVKSSASRMMNSAVFGQIIILMVYLPILSLEGIEGKMFKPMAQTVAFALLGAFILSLTYIPMMSSLVLFRKRKQKENLSEKYFAKIDAWYGRQLKKIIFYPKRIIIGTIVTFVVSIFILINLGGEFIPEIPEGDFAIDTRVLPGSNLNTSINAVQKGERILLERFPEVIKVVAKTGSSEIPTDPMPIDASDLMVILKDRKDWTSAKSYEELSDKMKKALEEIPGVTFSIQYPVAMRFNELMTGARQDVVCKIYGENLDTLAKYGKLLELECQGIKGAENIYLEPIAGLPQIVIRYDKAKIAQYGLTISDVNKVVNTSFAGQTAGTIYEGEKKFDLVIRLNSIERKNLENVQNLLVPINNTIQIPLSAIADVKEEMGPNQIQRENAQRRIIVGFNVKDRDVESIVNELNQKTDAKLKLPPGYFIEFGGAFENLRLAKKRLSIAVPISLFMIFLLLFFAFNSVKQSLLIFTAIPLSAIGGIFALWLRGMPFSISAGIGFIALFGVAVLNGIVLISEFNKIKNEGEEDNVEIVIKGSKNRLRPVLMTALVASFGFLPMALSNGEGAQVQRPLATVVIGGLLIATILTLFVLPMLYLYLEKSKNQGKGKLVSTLILVLGLLFNNNANAQNVLSLQQSIDTTLKNNQTIKSQKLYEEYIKKQSKTGWTIPQANLDFGIGQINSNYNDNSFGLSQNLKFPSIYNLEKKVLTAEFTKETIKTKESENEIKREVYLTYYEIVYLNKKLELLTKSDSILSNFFELQKIKFKNGESSILEKNFSENQLTELRIQKNEIETQLNLMLMKFNFLLNTNKFYEPEKTDLQISFDVKKDSTLLMQHPYIKFLKQEITIGETKFQLEKNKLLPDILASYNNLSITGTGADNVYYPKSKRFQSIQFGIGIPLFYGAQKNAISATKSHLVYLKSIYENSYKSYLLKYNQNYFSLKKQNEIIAMMDNSYSKNSESIITIANEKLKAGDLNYMEWILLIQNSIKTKLEYLDKVNSLNKSKIELKALNNFN